MGPKEKPAAVAAVTDEIIRLMRDKFNGRLRGCGTDRCSSECRFEVEGMKEPLIIIVTGEDV